MLCMVTRALSRSIRVAAKSTYGSYETVQRALENSIMSKQRREGRAGSLKTAFLSTMSSRFSPADRTVPASWIEELHQEDTWMQVVSFLGGLPASLVEKAPH